MAEFVVPAGFAQTMHEVYGASGDEWIARLPALLDACAERWSLRIEPPFVITRELIDTTLNRFEDSLQDEAEARP